MSYSHKVNHEGLLILEQPLLRVSIFSSIMIQFESEREIKKGPAREFTKNLSRLPQGDREGVPVPEQWHR